MTVNDKIALATNEIKYNVDCIFTFFAVYTVNVFNVPNNAILLKIPAIPKNQCISPYSLGLICDAK